MTLTLRLHVRRIAGVALGLLATLAFAAPANAQFGEAAGISEAMQQEYYRRDIRLFAEGLALDDAQRSVVESLFIDYEQEFNEGLARMRKRLEDMREEFSAADVDQVLRKIFKPIEDWSVEKRGMGDVFLENVKIVLTPEQIEMWPKFQRFLFREKNLNKGRLSGESLNLFQIVTDMDLTPPELQRVQPTLDEYDIALDLALRNRQGAITASQGDMFRSFAEQNPAVSLALLERHVQFSVAVRSVNDRFIEGLVEVMPEGKVPEFRQKALERAYPRVYRPTPVQAIFKAAKELPGLETAVLEAIIGLEAAFLTELRIINDQLATAVRDWEPREMQLRAEAFARRMTNAQPAPIEDPTREGFQRRDEMSRRYVRQLQALLTPEQFGQLPGGYRWAEDPGQERPAEERGVGSKTRGDPAGARAPDPIKAQPVPNAADAPSGNVPPKDAPATPD